MVIFFRLDYIWIQKNLKLPFFHQQYLQTWEHSLGYVLERNLASFPVDVENYTDNVQKKYYSPAGHHDQKDDKTTGQIKFWRSQ